MQLRNMYPQVPPPVNRPKQAAPFSGSVLVGGAPVLLESDSLQSIMALVGLAMRAKCAERRAPAEQEKVQ